jgi:hypothetical protein
MKRYIYRRRPFRDELATRDTGAGKGIDAKSSELARNAGSTYSLGLYALYEDDLAEVDTLEAIDDGLRDVGSL